MQGRLVLFCSCMALCLVPVSAQSRVTVMSGGVGVGYEIFDREYNINSDGNENGSSSVRRNDDDYERVVVTPVIRLTSETARNSTEFEYKPSFYYDVDEEEEDINHRLTFLAQQAIQQNWKILISDNYVNSDEYNTYATPSDYFDDEAVETNPYGEDNLRDESGRRRYWSNNLRISTDYTYLEESVMSLGYGWNVLRNDETDSTSYEDYDKHDISASVSHRIDSQWKTDAYVRYVRGLYDIPNESDGNTVGSALNNIDRDLQEYHAGVTVFSEFKPRHPVSLGYSFSMTDYDADDIGESEIHDFTLGYKWFSTPKLEVGLGGGPTYTKRTDGEDEWSGNGYLDISYKLPKGLLRFAAVAGTEFENFTGTENRGITEYYQGRIDYTSDLTRKLSLSLYGYARSENEDQVTETVRQTSLDSITQEIVQSATLDSVTEEITTDRYALGGSLDYRFMEKYTASLSYSYVQQESDRLEDEYDDQRFIVSISFDSDFFKW